MRVKESPLRPSRKRLDDRNAAADRGLEIERNAVAFRERGELLAVTGQQRLVCSHHRLAGRERGLHGAFCRIARTADDLDQHVDRRIARQRHRIGDPAKFLQIDVALLGAGTRTDAQRFRSDGRSAR